jgi:hypothetical protein
MASFWQAAGRALTETPSMPREVMLVPAALPVATWPEELMMVVPRIQATPGGDHELVKPVTVVTAGMRCCLTTMSKNSRTPMNPPMVTAIAGSVRRSSTPAAMPSAVANTA